MDNQSDQELEAPVHFGFEDIELKGFTRSVAELEWLLLVLVLLYYVAPGLHKENPGNLVLGMGLFAGFVLAFHYLNFYRREARWKIAVETWVMIIFITWNLVFTGGVDSPLLNLYLLVIITSGLTLGKLMTLLELALIAACYLWLGHEVYSTGVFSVNYFSQLMSKFAPFLLVAYITTMLSADLHYANRAFRVLSQTDELTGVLNRRAFRGLLQRELEKARRYSRPLSILMVDADALKTVNDQYGHDAGDKLLNLTATTIANALRGADVLARYGGDEFVVLLPETDPVHAMEAAERVRKAVSEASFIVGQARVGSTVSIGVASFPDHGHNALDLLQKADAGMYTAKERGRNQALSYAEVD